jgi:hypothetical protein
MGRFQTYLKALFKSFDELATNQFEKKLGSKSKES